LILADNNSIPIVWTINSRVDNYLKWGNVLRSDINPKAVHEFRKASRKLMVILGLFRAEGQVPKVLDQVKYWQKKFGPLRDIHVINTMISDNKILNEICDKSANEETEIIIRKREHLLDTAFKADLHSAVENILMMVESDPSVFFLRMRYYWSEKYKKLIVHLEKPTSSNFKSLHKLRVKYKKVRYPIEFFQSAGLLDGGKDPSLKYWQELLGQIHDCKIILDWCSNHNGVELPDHIVEKSEKLIVQFKSEITVFKKFMQDNNLRMFTLF
jgi:CHAD domain-containing protein